MVFTPSIHPFHPTPRTASTGAALVLQSRMDQALLQSRLVDKLDSNAVCGTLYIRDLTTGKIPPWKHLVWFAQHLKQDIGSLKSAQPISILEALEHFSNIQLQT